MNLVEIAQKINDLKSPLFNTSVETNRIVIKVFGVYKLQKIEITQVDSVYNLDYFTNGFNGSVVAYSIEVDSIDAILCKLSEYITAHKLSIPSNLCGDLYDKVTLDEVNSSNKWYNYTYTPEINFVRKLFGTNLKTISFEYGVADEIYCITYSNEKFKTKNTYELNKKLKQISEGRLTK